MTDLGPAVRQALRQTFVLGLGRKPVPKIDGLEHLEARDKALAALSLVGQQLRFRRVAAAPQDLPNPLAAAIHGDSRKLMPEAARKALSPILTDKKVDDLIASIVVERCAAASVRLHPFDLPAALRLLRTIPQRLQGAEKAFVVMCDAGASAAKAVDGITLETWHEFPKPERVAFVRAMRRADPAGARALVQETFASDTADMRASLVETFSTGLSSDDSAFLETALGDRAAKVREAASLLLASVRGSKAYGERLDAAMTLLSIKGMLGMGRSLALATPYVKKASEVFDELERIFRGLYIDDIAERLKLSIDDLIGLAPSNAPMLIALLTGAALVAKRHEQAAKLADKGSLTTVFIVRSYNEALLRLSPDERTAFITKSLNVDGEGSKLTSFDLRRLYDLLGGAVSAPVFDRLLAAPSLQEDIEQAAAGEGRSRLDADTFVALVALAPRERLARLAPLIDRLPPSIAQTPRALVRFFLTLQPG
jgi:hypothetical protein